MSDYPEEWPEALAYHVATQDLVTVNLGGPAEIHTDGKATKLDRIASCADGHRRVFWDHGPDEGTWYCCPVCCFRSSLNPPK